MLAEPTASLSMFSSHFWQCFIARASSECLFFLTTRDVVRLRSFQCTRYAGASLPVPHCITTGTVPSQAARYAALLGGCNIITSLVETRSKRIPDC